jgi:hypothetical protein
MCGTLRSGLRRQKRLTKAQKGSQSLIAVALLSAAQMCRADAQKAACESLQAVCDMARIASRFAESDCTGRLLEVTKQLRQGNPEADRQHFEDAQTGLPAPILQLGDVDPPNS